MRGMMAFSLSHVGKFLFSMRSYSFIILCHLSFYTVIAVWIGLKGREGPLCWSRNLTGRDVLSCYGTVVS